MSLRDRISKVGTIEPVEYEGITFYVKTKNVRGQAAFQDKLAAFKSTGSELEDVDQLIETLAENLIEKIDDYPDVKEFLGALPSMKDLYNIGAFLSTALSETESKNSSSPSESVPTAPAVQKDVKKEEQPADSIAEK